MTAWYGKIAAIGACLGVSTAGVVAQVSTSELPSKENLSIWLIVVLISFLGLICLWLKPRIDKALDAWPEMPAITELITTTAPGIVKICEQNTKDLHSLARSSAISASAATTMAMVVSSMQSQMIMNKTLILVVACTRVDQIVLDGVLRMVALKFGLTLFFAANLHEAAPRLGNARTVVMDADVEDKGTMEGFLNVANCPVILHIEDTNGFSDHERVFAVVAKAQSIDILRAEMERAILSTQNR